MNSIDPARPGSAPATRSAPWEYAAPWGARGYVTELDGPVHWIEFSSEAKEGESQPPIVFVHGLGGSHLNWCLLGPQLTAGRRVVALDLRGFGLTPGLRVNSTVQANAHLLDRFINEVIGTPVILVGNSMGGLISILETAANPSAIQSVVLIDPALPLPVQKPDWQVGGQFLLYALPGLGPLAVAKLMSSVSPEEAVRQLVQLCFADPSRSDPELIKADVALVARRHPATGRSGVGPRPDIPRRRPFAAAGPQPPRELQRDDGRHRRPGPAHRRRSRPAGAGGGHAPGRRAEPAMGVRYAPRSRAYPAARGPPRRRRPDPGLAGPARHLRTQPCSS